MKETCVNSPCLFLVSFIEKYLELLAKSIGHLPT